MRVCVVCSRLPDLSVASAVSFKLPGFKPLSLTLHLAKGVIEVARLHAVAPYADDLVVAGASHFERAPFSPA